MIPFGSQRALGQDLATHLLNEYDNELMEVAEVRGAIAQDLHGAFAEWELQARALTQCRNYLYSLSVNPDPAQGELTREQYFDYIDRTEQELGLSGQPRAIIFHIKDGREHCHVVWSRIDTDNGKAIQIAFDRQKLMMVTREFAREQGLSLPDGYFKDRNRKDRQLILYEMHQQRTTGMTKEERMEHVTDAWRQSDSPKAFVQALAARGYILATGKRPYVLVDLYGHMNALPKLIDDKTVRTKDIRAFLEKEFPPESLPTVEEARELATRHREEIEGFREHEQRAQALAALKTMQAARRTGLEKQQGVLRQRQHKQRQSLAKEQRAGRDQHRAAYLAKTRHIRRERYERRPQGLAAFLGRVSGVELIRKAVHRYQHRRRYRSYLKERNRLRQRQDRQRRELARRHEMQALDLQRKIRALGHIDKRELKSLEESLRAEQRIADRGGRGQMPAIRIDLEPYGRPFAPHEARDRRNQWLTDEYDQAIARRIRSVDLEGDFTRAAEGDQETGDTSDSSEGPHPQTESRVERARRPRSRPRRKSRARDRDKDRGR